MQEKLKVLDLFSGIGGFSLGLERTGGFETVAFCEIDPFCQKVLKKHWPDVQIYDDVRTLNYDRAVDVITGGFPCQDVSIANQTPLGMAGDRTSLWKYYLKLIKEKKPKYVIAENVTALRFRGLEQILGQLSEVGYDAEWHCLPASAFGSIQNRDRIWIIAYPSGQRVKGLLSSKNISQARQGRACRQEDLQQVYANPFGGNSWPQPLIRGGRRQFPDWVDRIHALGNSLDPDIPEMIGYAILEAEK